MRRNAQPRKYILDRLKTTMYSFKLLVKKLPYYLARQWKIFFGASVQQCANCGPRQI
jgi:hypothetical protein